jgi:hypothetical protein
MVNFTSVYLVNRDSYIHTSYRLCIHHLIFQNYSSHKIRCVFFLLCYTFYLYVIYTYFHKDYHIFIYIFKNIPDVWKVCNCIISCGKIWKRWVNLLQDCCTRAIKHTSSTMPHCVIDLNFYTKTFGNDSQNYYTVFLKGNKQMNHYTTTKIRK